MAILPIPDLVILILLFLFSMVVCIVLLDFPEWLSTIQMVPVEGIAADGFRIVAREISNHALPRLRAFLGGGRTHFSAEHGIGGLLLSIRHAVIQSLKGRDELGHSRLVRLDD